MSRLDSSPSTSYLKRSLREGTVIVISDGSYFPRYNIGSCAWILSTPDGKEWIEGGGVILGVLHEQNSYRNELGGQLGIISFINMIILPYSKYHITTVCDGLAALKSVGIDVEYIKCKRKKWI